MSAEVAYNLEVSEDPLMSPVKIDLGWQPKTPLDLISCDQVPVKTVNDFKENLKRSLYDALILSNI